MKIAIPDAISADPVVSGVWTGWAQTDQRSPESSGFVVHKVILNVLYRVTQKQGAPAPARELSAHGPPTTGHTAVSRHGTKVPKWWFIGEKQRG